MPTTLENTPALSTADTAAAAGPLLNAADRCDACGAQAYAKAIIDVDFEGHESSLLFCAHHWRQHKDKLMVVALAFHDETYLLDLPKTPGTGGSAFA